MTAKTFFENGVLKQNIINTSDFNVILSALENFLDFYWHFIMFGFF